MSIYFGVATTQMCRLFAKGRPQRQGLEGQRSCSEGMKPIGGTPQSPVFAMYRKKSPKRTFKQQMLQGGDATVVDLPKVGITGNSHFLFQELNNKEIADHVEAWLKARGL